MSATGVSDFFLVFCERAVTGSDGKLNIEGIYNELYAPDFPAKQEALVLSGTLEWRRETEGMQPFTVHLLDPHDKPIFTIEGQTEVDARSEARAPAKTHLIFPLENLVFVNPGRYRIVVLVSDGELAGPSLHLLRSGILDL
jgi:hypothetical protein|tara:strand:+ start:2169 stop:2591 length:423 start_codon:yes stop_codon:yes gene_type:complete